MDPTDLMRERAAIAPPVRSSGPSAQAPATTLTHLAERGSREVVELGMAGKVHRYRKAAGGHVDDRELGGEERLVAGQLLKPLGF